MLGGIIGDIVGSRLEYRNCKVKDFKLLTEYNFITDDTIMTIALADALMNGENIKQSYINWGRQYFEKDYGPNFRKWLSSLKPEPYYSFGNGSAMRVGIIPYVARNIKEAEKMAIESALPSHNHPIGVVGACAIAVAGRMALEGYSKIEIKKTITQFYGYNLDRKIDDIRPLYQYEISCATSVPESIIAFLEAENFEDAIRNSISLGGDADTMACITGSIAYPYFQNKNDTTINKIWELILKENYFDENMEKVISVFIEKFLYKKNIKTEVNLLGTLNSYDFLSHEQLSIIKINDNKPETIIQKIISYLKF